MANSCPAVGWIFPVENPDECELVSILSFLSPAQESELCFPAELNSEQQHIVNFRTLGSLILIV